MTDLVPEVWESVLQGKKSYGAYGPRDVLIIKSSGSLVGAEVVPRKKGDLTQEDRDRLASEGIPRESWEDDVELMIARRCKEKKYNIIGVEDSLDLTAECVLEKITSILKTTKMPGVMIIYFGPGRKNKGDWCFRDGFITFHDLMKIYDQHFSGREMMMVSDCSYSGKWVDLAMDHLDNCKIPPCAHHARATGKLLSVVTSCRSDEIPYTLYFSARAYANDKNTGHIYLKRAVVAENQHICLCQNCDLICGAPNLDAPCQLPSASTWQQVKLAQRLFKVRNATEWAIVLVVDDIIIIDQILKGELSPVDCGEIVQAGYGSEPPAEVKQWITKEYPGHNCF